jgi:chorismate lyase/3-hydroxybenzoate synthase
MVQGCEKPQFDPLLRRAPRVSYRVADAASALKETGTLALFGFGAGGPAIDDPRALQVALECFDAPAPLEIWQVDAPVNHGRDGDLRWSAGGGWLFAAIELDERNLGGPKNAAASAYEQLSRFIGQRAERHVLRIWNYLGAINQGSGDAERYKHFCDGRAAGMGEFFTEGFPAASAIGHHGPAHRLQVYLLACDQPGERVENPRQVSAWRYPREYGRTPPSFARAMSLPAQDVLVNLEALLTTAGMPIGFETHSPLKAYVRNAVDAPRVRDFLRRRLADVPVLLLHGDICRSELLVEIDGWRYA